MNILKWRSSSYVFKKGKAGSGRRMAETIGSALSTETDLGSRKVQKDLDYGTGVGGERLTRHMAGWTKPSKKTLSLYAAEILKYK